MTTPLPSRLRESAKVLRALHGIVTVSNRIADELAEAADALEAGPWMPIETAPKDGTMFLCWVSAVRYGETDEGQRYQEEVSQIDFCQWRTQADIPDCGWFEPFCGQIGDEQDVTLWAPLPVAPGAQVAQEGGGVSASAYLAKVEADPRRAAALQRARDRAAGVPVTKTTDGGTTK